MSGNDSIFHGNKKDRDSLLNSSIPNIPNEPETDNVYKGFKSGVKNKSSNSYSDKDLLIQYYIAKKKDWNSNQNEVDKIQSIKVTNVKLKKAAELKLFKGPFQNSHRSSQSKNSSRKTTKRMYNSNS